MKHIRTTIPNRLTGPGISKIFGGFPADLKIGETYELTWDFELRGWVFQGYKAESFEWATPLNKMK
jgi:hypothetical protein